MRAEAKQGVKFRLSAGILVALLQRAPALRIAEGGAEFAASSPVGAMVRSAIAAASLLGTPLHSLAGGSTVLVASSGASTGISVAAQSQVQIAYEVGGTATSPQSWTIGGSIPPGLNFSGLTSAGTVDTPTASGALIVTGTPATAGTYNLTLQAWEGPDATEVGSDIFPYQIVVTPSAGGAPSFTAQPQDQTGTIGQTVTFSAAASGSPSYQWQFNGSNIPGATGAVLAIANVQLSNAGIYSVDAVNSNGATESNNATLTVVNTINGPVFTVQPVQQSVANGSTVVFSASASGTPAPAYQWTLNGVALADGGGVAGVNGPILVVTGAAPASAGLYECIASNAGGVTSSNQANLTVVTSTTDIGRLINLSTRAQVGTGGNVLIVGFVVGGAGTSGTKPVLVRGSGPALNAFGVTGTLPDPLLQLTNLTTNTLVATNSAWGGSAAIAAESAAVGAQPFANPGSKDTALYESGSTALAPDGYTAEISGASGDTGVALAEVYDATPAGTYTLATPRLTNLSARVQVGTGASILIAGFVIGGSTGKTVLIRASGPALVPFGVPGTLPDPQLQLNSGGTVLATNSGWGGNLQIASVASSVGAFTWGNLSSADSALLVTLSPGSYTAQVAGASGDTGVALVEVYEVP